MNTANDLLVAAREALTRGHIAVATQGFLAAAAATPYDKAATYAAANGLRACGDARAAAAVLEFALSKSPQSAGILEALAGAYDVLGMTGEAADRRAQAAEIYAFEVSVRPDSVAGWVNLGKIRAALGQAEEAKLAYKRAAEILFGFAQSHFTAGRHAVAADFLHQILALDPTHEPAQTLLHESATAADQNAAIVSLLQFAWAADKANAYAEARGNYDAVLAQSPGHIFALSRLLTIDGIEGRLDDADDHHRQLTASLANTDPGDTSWMHLTLIAYQSVVRPLPEPLYKAVAGAIDAQLLAEAPRPLPQPVLPHPGLPRPSGGRVRIGYLSSFFRDHPVGHVTAELFAAHDRARFDVHVFYLPDGKPTEFTQTIAAGAEHFITLADMPEAMVAQIAAHDLDILIYLDGYMSPVLLPVVSARPARAQIFWLGHAGNCDISGIDYLIADANVVPPEDEALYTAKVIRLPDTFHCASPHAIGPAISRAEAGLPPEGFVFCAFNNPEKIDRTVFDVWMRILARVEGSVLWLSRTLSAAVADNLRASADAQGIDGARLIFASRLPDKTQHLARHRLCGLFLDTLTLNASTTALDALWSGLPVLTVTGSRFGARLATSHLHAAGLDDMAVATLGAYEDRAVHLATHPEDLNTIHARLAVNRESQPLFKIGTFCRALEAGLDGIHQDTRRP